MREKENSLATTKKKKKKVQVLDCLGEGRRCMMNEEEKKNKK